MITCLVDLFPLANGLESAHVAATTMWPAQNFIYWWQSFNIVDQICLVIPDPCQFADACLPNTDNTWVSRHPTQGAATAKIPGYQLVEADCSLNIPDQFRDKVLIWLISWLAEAHLDHCNWSVILPLSHHTLHCHLAASILCLLL